MSSSAYSACLQVDPSLRRFVLASGLILAAAGVPLILTMPLALPIKAPFVAAWLCLCARDIQKLRKAYTCYCALQVGKEGEVRLRDNDGNWHEARLLAGSILLRRLGWIRIGDTRGLVFAELVRGSCSEGQDWRRLQVIWRHFGARY